MTVSAAEIDALLDELETEDPLDFGALPIAEDEARRLVCLGMAKLSEDLHAQGLSDRQVEALALVVAARSVLENLALHVERLSRAGDAPDAGELLRALMRR